jgi:hypothetical protein
MAGWRRCTLRIFCLPRVGTREDDGASIGYMMEEARAPVLIWSFLFLERLFGSRVLYKGSSQDSGLELIVQGKVYFVFMKTIFI